MNHRQQDPVHRAFRIAYDGSAYHGFQRQPTVPTVEDSLLAAFDSLDVNALDANYAAAGRTDAGVSAAAQTIAVTVPAWLGPEALNGRLPDDVRAWAAADIDRTFHPRYDATERVYGYHLVVDAFDLERANDAADRLTGTHDFRDLSAAGEDTTRHLDRLTLEREGDIVRLTAAGASFVHQQVRRIASVIEDVGSGARSPDFVDRLLDPTTVVEGGDGVAPAPPAPLVLLDIRYDAITFTSSIQEAVPFDDRARSLHGRLEAMRALSERLDREGDQHR